jgi:hypothetical protein
LLLSLTLCVAVVLPLAAQIAEVPPRVLVIDATKSFASTLRTGALIGALRSSGAMRVDVILADVESVLEDPLPGEPDDDVVYDVIVLLPRGLDNATARRIWILSDAPDDLPPAVRAAWQIIGQAAEAVFVPLATAIDVTEDLYPSLLWAGYRARGWLR